MIDSPIAVVTGASRGIGRAIALRLSAEGRTVVAVGRDAAALEAVAAQARAEGHAILPRIVELEDRMAARALIRDVESSLGAVDALVNCAGINISRPFLEITDDEWDRSFAVNLHSVFAITQEALRAMVERRRGAVVTVSSVLGLIAGPLPYSATKWALEGVTRSLARDFAAHGVRVNAVAPGGTATPMNGYSGDEAVADSHLPMGRLAMPGEIAAAAVFLLSDDASYINGATLVVDGGGFS